MSTCPETFRNLGAGDIDERGHAKRLAGLLYNGMLSGMVAVWVLVCACAVWVWCGAAVVNVVRV